MMMPDTLAYDEHGTLLSWTQPALLPAPRPHRTLAQRIAGHQAALARLHAEARRADTRKKYLLGAAAQKIMPNITPETCAALAYDFEHTATPEIRAQLAARGAVLLAPALIFHARTNT